MPSFDRGGQQPILKGADRGDNPEPRGGGGRSAGTLIVHRLAHDEALSSGGVRSEMDILQSRGHHLTVGNLKQHAAQWAQFARGTAGAVAGFDIEASIVTMAGK